MSERATEAVAVVEADPPTPPPFCFEVAVNVDEDSEDIDSSSCGAGFKIYKDISVRLLNCASFCHLHAPKFDTN